MFFPSRREITQFRKQGLLVPVYKEIKSLEEPLLYFDKLRDKRFSFFLDSARTQQPTGRYSFAGTKPFLVFRSREREIEIDRNGRVEKLRGNPISHLRHISNKYRSVRLRGLPNFTGGGVGYFGYDARRFFEVLPRIAADDIQIPDVYFAFYDTLVAFDHLKKRTMLISNVMPDGRLDKAYDEAVGRIEELEGGLKKGASGCRKTHRKSELKIHSSFTRARFTDVVKRAKHYIKRGDIYQANLSQRLSVRSEVEPFELYKALRRINPSPFACFLDLDGVKIASSSPERLLKLEGDLLQTRPIAGTRPRGEDADEDKRFSRNLLLSPKERAEHLMLVDLERNDLGRVCEYGSVRVDEFMVLERYSHVIHIVSNVCGRLRRGKDRFDVLRAAFPGGTITGVPKVRCMEIIEELEPVTRNVYTGSIGYLSFNGDMDLNIAIRTFVLKDGWAHVQAGAGIVADSDPQREYYETLYKAQALLETLKETD